MTIAGAGASLASLALHFSNKGYDQFGCKTETLMMSGSLNTNKFCTREMAACNFLPKYLKGSDRSNASIACNETVSIASNMRCAAVQYQCFGLCEMYQVRSLAQPPNAEATDDTSTAEYFLITYMEVQTTLYKKRSLSYRSTACWDRL